MVKKWMTRLNLAAASAIVMLIIAALYLLWSTPSDFPATDALARKSNLPKGAFSRPASDYDAIKEPILNLKFSPLSVQLPDLKRHLHYFGQNSRPDAKDENPVLYFSFGTTAPTALLQGKRYYLSYDKGHKQYAFSPQNEPTSLWMEVTPHNNQATVRLSMKGDNDQIISEPPSHAAFALAEKEYTRSGNTSWELGKWKVDGTLLARQKAKWYGIDRFLEKHGGEEFKDFANKQRIDFGEPSEIYSIYVGPKDCMAWKEGRWHVFPPGKETLGYPILCVKKIDDRIMGLELWDAEGKGKIVLNLLKTTETWLPKNIMQSFKFMGARTRHQFVFEINKERMLLKPHDWLLLTDKGWKKLVTPEDIDLYVDRKTSGPLFVFDGIEKKDDKQIIMGTLFNASRTDKAAVELPLQGSGASGGDQKSKQAIPGRNGTQPGMPPQRMQANAPEDNKNLSPSPLEK